MSSAGDAPAASAEADVPQPSRVRGVMTSPVVTVEMDDRLALVKTLFDNARFHHLLVVEAGRLVGVLSDRDLLKAISPYVGRPAETTRDALTLDRRVHQVMSRDPVTVTADDSITQAADVMLSRAISCLPVVDEGGYPIGIVTWRDLLRQLRESIGPPAPTA